MDIQCNSLGKKRQSTKTNVRTISTVSFSVDIVWRLATIYYHGLNKKKLNVSLHITFIVKKM
jgi:hypothetical protein